MKEKHKSPGFVKYNNSFGHSQWYPLFSLLFRLKAIIILLINKKKAIDLGDKKIQPNGKKLIIKS